MNLFDLTGKVALVTGGAHSIGFGIGVGLAQAGATVCFNCTNEESRAKGVAAYKEAGFDVRGFVCDVTDEKAVQALVAQIREEVGIIDILVNNAGIIKRIPMTEMSVEDFSKVVDVDLIAPFICSKAVIPGMLEKGHGKIINICSMMSELGRETVSAYAAAKGGLKMLTRNICSEFGGANIPSTSLSFPRRLQAAGVLPTIWWVLRCSWQAMPPTSSTAMCCMWTAAFWPTSVSSPEVEACT